MRSALTMVRASMSLLPLALFKPLQAGRYHDPRVSKTYDFIVADDGSTVSILPPEL